MKTAGHHTNSTTDTARGLPDEGEVGVNMLVRVKVLKLNG